jgi:hypothetical protein
MRFTKIVLSMAFFFILIMPQSFPEIKLFFLFLSIVGILVSFSLIEEFKVDFVTLMYYVYFSIIIIIWAFLSLIKGNPVIAIIDALRLYIVFMWSYALIVVYISNVNYEKYLPVIFSLAAIIIASINFYVVGDAVLELDSIPNFIKNEMLLEIGIHEGYTQLNSLNIGILSFITPFLISILLLNPKRNPYIVIVALFVSILAVALASRRAILFIIFLAPFLAYMASKLAQGVNIGKPMRRFYLILFVFIATLLSLLYLYHPIIYEGLMDRLFEVFTSDGHRLRNLQSEQLIQGFSNNFILGSGFGGQVDIVRNSERPWVFELTYVQMLFNFGLTGMVSWFILFSTFFFIAIMKIRTFSGEKSEYISMLVGLVSVLIVSWSNPYLKSFDYIFILSIIPLIISSINRKKCFQSLKGGL